MLVVVARSELCPHPEPIYNNTFVGGYIRRIPKMDPKQLDPSIVRALPTGCQILTITKHGDTNVSNRSRTI